MYSRIFVLILVVGLGVGVGIAALGDPRLAADEPSIDRLSQRAAGDLAERLKRGESSELDPEQLAQVVESLIQILDEEISERRVLEEQLEEVRAEMADLQQILRANVQAAVSANGINTASQQPRTRIEQTVEDRLAASGFTAQQIESIRRREAEGVMQQIELDDRARREGWVDTPRYFDEFNNLTNGADTVRRDLGDDAYSRYLFASGRPNSITVGTVIETSPAEQAGLLRGDVIKSYGGQRVFSTTQLTKLRSEGVRGAPVTVEVIRDGKLMQISMRRGPMGIRTAPGMVDPNAPGGG